MFSNTEQVRGVRDLSGSSDMGRVEQQDNTTWFMYIAQCRDGELYVGIAKDAERRIREHNTTSKCRYTRFRKPVKLFYKECCDDYSAARRREREVKKFSRKKKIGLAAAV